jgi:hypothetical protein
MMATRSGKSELTAAVEFAPGRRGLAVSSRAPCAQFRRVQQAEERCRPAGQAIATDGPAQVMLNTIDTADREMVAAAGVMAQFSAWAIVV